MQVKALPRPGEKAVALARTERPGGQMASAALGCARLGLRAAFAGAVGDDSAGEGALAPLREAGVDVEAVACHGGVPTRRASIWIDADGERTLVGHRDPGLALVPARLDRKIVTSSRLLMVDTIDRDVTAWAMRVAHGAGVPVLIDADTPDAATIQLIRGAEFPIVSEGFADEISRGTSWADGVRALGEGALMAVATRGARGAVAWHDGRLLEVPAREVPVRDTTGAGDAFRAGFAWALLEGCDAPAVLRAAVTAGALACRRVGAQAALPDRVALQAALQEA
jgi:sugar/nucleoside kinase (ribokinase family)